MEALSEQIDNNVEGSFTATAKGRQDKYSTHKQKDIQAMNKSDSIVIIPTYNEKENIEKIIRAVFSLEKCFNILVIDDGSPDGTAAIVHRLIDNEFADRLFIICLLYTSPSPRDS